MKGRITAIIIALLFLSVYFLGVTFFASPLRPAPVKQITVTPTIGLLEYVSYKGTTGKNALQLLEEKFQVEKEASGLVISINRRKANSLEHEYWAFYVNGKLASVGPSDYQTKDGDIIEWKIEKY